MHGAVFFHQVAVFRSLAWRRIKRMSKTNEYKSQVERNQAKGIAEATMILGSARRRNERLGMRGLLC